MLPAMDTFDDCPNNSDEILLTDFYERGEFDQEAAINQLAELDPPPEIDLLTVAEQAINDGLGHSPSSNRAAPGTVTRDESPTC